MHRNKSEILVKERYVLHFSAFLIPMNKSGTSSTGLTVSTVFIPPPGRFYNRFFLDNFTFKRDFRFFNVSGKINRILAIVLLSIPASISNSNNIS